MITHLRPSALMDLRSSCLHPCAFCTLPTPFSSACRAQSMNSPSTPLSPADLPREDFHVMIAHLRPSALMDLTEEQLDATFHSVAPVRRVRLNRRVGVGGCERCG